MRESHAYGNADGDVHSDGNGNANRDGHSYCNSDIYSDSDSDSNGNRDGHSYGYGYGYSNGNRIAAGYTDATASSHAAATAVVLTDRLELARKPREFLDSIDVTGRSSVTDEPRAMAGIY